MRNQSGNDGDKQDIGGSLEGGVDITSSKKIARELIAQAKPVAKLQAPALRVANAVLDNADKVDF